MGEGLSQGAWGLGLLADRQGGAAFHPGHFSLPSLLCFRVALCIPAFRSESQERGEAEPRAGLLRRGSLPPPCFRLPSTEQHSEWKPSPNMTSKPLQMTS